MTHQVLGIYAPQKGALMANSETPLPKDRRVLEIRGQDHSLGVSPALHVSAAAGRVASRAWAWEVEVSSGLPKGQAA